MRCDFKIGERPGQAAGRIHAAAKAGTPPAVRTVPPSRNPLGVPCAIPPVNDCSLVLEGVLTNLGADSPLEPFDANMSRPHHAVDNHWARRARTGATF